MFIADNSNKSSATDAYPYDTSQDVAALLSELGLSAPRDAATSPPSPPRQYLDDVCNPTILREQQLLLDSGAYLGADARMATDAYCPLLLEQQQQQQQQQSYPMSYGLAAPYHLPLSFTNPQGPEAELAAVTNRAITFAAPIIRAAGVPIQVAPMSNTFDGGLSLSPRQHQLSRNNSRSSMCTNLTRTNSRGTSGRSASSRSRTSSYSSGSVSFYSDRKTYQCFIPGCYTTFSRGRDMLRHVIGCANNSLERKFKHGCDYCDKEYSRKDSLLRHQKKKHPEQVPRPSSTARGTAAVDASAAAAAAAAV